MKKRMIIGVLGLVILMFLIIVSCKFFGFNVSEIIRGGLFYIMLFKKDFDYKDLFNEKEQDIVFIKFIYNGKVYIINREDILDIKDLIYVNLVFNNNVEGFKKLIFDVEEYRKVKNLYVDDNGFLLIVEVFYYVRNLEYFKNGFIY